MPNFAQNQAGEMDLRPGAPGVNCAYLASDYPRTNCVHQLLEQQALRTPSSGAVEFQGRTLTYAELHARANQLARVLRKQGVGPEVLVGLCVERSLEMVVALLGILKAGGAYVPLDPAYPSDRIKYVLEDARAKVLLTQQHLLKSLPSTSAKVICIDSDWKCVAGESTEVIETEVKPNNLAYVIYTSGSTGKPKGVQLEHRSVVNFLWSMRQEPGLSANDVLVAVTTLSFDIAGLEMYLPLLVGARVVIASAETTYDGRRLAAVLRESGATVMQATPATWRILFESGWAGDRKLKVLVGGEALSAELARKLAESCGPVWNMYGPTETTIWSSIYRVTGRDDRMVPIGRPIANTSFYVLDQSGEPVGLGSEGELYIGGEGLARGYFERDDLTGERFVADPFASHVGARMYRTGDLARVRADGNVEFLGRIDHQVKIRGFRIELGEIEAVLERHPSVLHAVVVAREDTPGDKRLVGYVVPQPAVVLTSAEVRSHLQQAVPDYMVPSAFVQLGTLPLTPNGKVDRKALPAPKATDFEADRNYVAPRDATELKLARLWEQVLGVRPIGVTTSFFDLGGRSLLAARLFMRITNEFGKDLPISTLFRAPTVEQLARELRPTADAENHSSLIEIQRHGSKPPFFCIHGGEGSTLFLHRLARELGPDQPFYAFEAEGLDGLKFHRTTVKEMAEHFVCAMKKIQPEGPYHIGGYCFGGLVAFEMAQQLRRDGDRAGLVALFSGQLRFNRRLASQPTGTQPTSSRERALRLLHSPSKALGWRLAKLAQDIRSGLRMMTCRLFLSFGLRIPQGMRTMYIVRMLQAAEEQYIPQKYPGTIVLFRGGGLEENADGPKMGWDGLAETIESYQIGESGLRSRRDIMNEPLVTDLAKQLAACLERGRDAEGVISQRTELNGSLVNATSDRAMAVTEPAR